jgi:hypothetical protein
MANMKIISMYAAKEAELRADTRAELRDVAAMLSLQINELIEIAQRLRVDVDRLMQEDKGATLNG